MLAGAPWAALISALGAIKSDLPLPLFHLLLRSDSWWSVLPKSPSGLHSESGRGRKRERETETETDSRVSGWGAAEKKMSEREAERERVKVRGRGRKENK